jgi:short-subunit dehydrogenase
VYMNPKDKVVIVTGASSGIGEATARQFGREGSKVVLAARRIERLNLLAQEIIEMNTGAETLVIQSDLTKLEDIQNLVSATIEKFGRVDILVNNAGFGRIDWLENLDPVKDIQSQFDVNVLGVIQTTRQVLPIMIKQRSGHIINMGSMSGLVGSPTYTIYSATKHAVHGFSESLRREIQPWGIDVSMLYPAGVKTEFQSRAGIKRKTGATTPKALLLTAEDIGQAEDVEAHVVPEDGIRLAERLRVPEEQPELPAARGVHREQDGHDQRGAHRQRLKALGVERDPDGSFACHEHELAGRQRSHGEPDVHREDREREGPGRPADGGLRGERTQEDVPVPRLAEPEPVGVEGDASWNDDRQDEESTEGDEPPVEGHWAHLDRSRAKPEDVQPSSRPKNR